MRKSPKNSKALPMTPIPVRFSKQDDKQLRSLQTQTGISLSEIVRRAVRYAAPKFLSGKVNISHFPAEADNAA